MSICFLKSSDNHSSISSYNPNKPYRWTNYLTEAIRLPPNSQVAYVSSQFLINANIDIENQPAYIQVSDETYPMTMITRFAYESSGLQYGSIFENINSYVYSANEFGMDSDYASVKLTQQTHFGEIQKVYERGFQLLYDIQNQKVELRTDINLAIDQYNLYFHALSSNPSFDSASWTGGPGASVPSRLNFTDKVDSKFQADAGFKVANSPDNTATFAGGNNFGYILNQYTDNGNARPRVYQGGANFYNVGFATNGLNASAYNYENPASTEGILAFDGGSYPMFMGLTGIKKSIGLLTPSSDPQQSNTGGHVFPGGFSAPSGGYAIVGHTNTQQSKANLHFDATSTSRVGYTGWTQGFFGVHSIPFIRQTGADTINDLLIGLDPNNIQDQVDAYNLLTDLNEGRDEYADEAYARYLLGIEMLEEENAPGDFRLKASPQILEAVLEGSLHGIESSKYVSCGNDLDLFELSQGTNTAASPAYQFDATANYSINCYETTAGRTAASLWFRFRWVNKSQMNIEFTLQVDGHPGTYDPATDSLYEPAGYIAPAPAVPDTPQNILLNPASNGSSVNITTSTLFTDSGGEGGDYAPNESYSIDFVAPAGTNAAFTINDFVFEHTSSQMYDRLGVQKSSDGVTWTNVSFAGFNSSATATAPWSNSYGIPPQPGWIFPLNTSDLIAKGGNPAATYDVGERYVRFTFLSDGAAQRAGWSLNMTAVATTATDINDPRDKWCLLGSMNVGNYEYHIPPYMGDIGVVYYPIAHQPLGSDFGRPLIKGWFDVRETNRCFQSNNNGGVNQYQPFTSQNPFFNADYLGTLRYDTTKPTDKTATSHNLVQAGYAGALVNFDGATGALTTTSYFMSIPELQLASDVFYNMVGLPAFLRGEPETEIGYILGFHEVGNTTSELETAQDPLIPTLYKLQGQYTITQSSSAFTNHIQLTNLPIKSQNGVVSSTNKTIYVCDTLCLSTADTTGYRYYCDKAPYPLWVDLNNLETIELNRIDVLISTDKNTPQTTLTGNTDLVIIFRSKSEGTLPNSIPMNSMNVTRTY